MGTVKKTTKYYFDNYGEAVEFRNTHGGKLYQTAVSGFTKITIVVEI